MALQDGKVVGDEVVGEVEFPVFVVEAMAELDADVLIQQVVAEGEETLTLLEDFGVEAYRTETGDIVLTQVGSTIRVEYD